MQFGVLGPVAVWTADGQPVPVSGLKVRALLAVLLIHEGRPVPSRRLMDALWGDHLPGDPGGTLSGKVTQLRRALERVEPGARRLVVSPPPGYRLNVDADAVDAHRFRVLTAQARAATDPRTRARQLCDALALWRGPAFADFADEAFASAAAARLTEERLVALEDQAEVRLVLGEHSALVAELGELLAAHPLRQRLRAAHMRALCRSGRQSEALDSYRDLRRRLAEDLGLDPSAELTALHEEVLAGGTASFASPRTPTPPPHTNLPASMSELIGRNEAVAGLRSRLGAHRLITLTGPGGVGKSRLALAVANGLASQHVDAKSDFADGVWLAELGALAAGAPRGPEDVVTAALDIRDEAGATDRLVDALRARRILLVLDNCEHVVEQAADLAGRLLRGCPRLHILATSREPLGLSEEVVWTVPPLEVPDPAGGLEVVARSPAARLFTARASAAAPGFALTAGNARSVAVLCGRLDGLPLALELAATRVRALGVDELVARLDDRFRLLAHGRRDAPARQQTLTAVIDWSWHLLTEPERVVLRRLAVHADGCTLDAAEELCADAGPAVTAGVAGAGGSAHPISSDQVADLIANLVDRSLVAVTQGHDGLRYSLLESVAAYCGHRLAEAGEARWALDRHSRYYTQLAVRTAPHLYGHDQHTALRLLDNETANLRNALDHAVREHAADRALCLADALTWYWFLRGRLNEARRSLRAALGANRQSPSDRPCQLRAKSATWLAGIEILLGVAAAIEVDAPDAGSAGHGESDATGPDRATEYGRNSGGAAGGRGCRHAVDPVDRARAEWFLAYAQTDLGDAPAVDRRLERALAVFRDAGDRWGTAAVLGTRAKQCYLRADLAGLARDGGQSAELFRDVGDRWGMLQATAWLGGRAEIVGDYAGATLLGREGLRMAEELGLWPEVSVRLGWLGWLAVQQGDYAEARDLSGQALRLATEQGFRVGETFAAIGVAFAARRQGDLDVAEHHLRRLLRAAGPDDESGTPPVHLCLVLTDLGLLVEQRGHPAEAMSLHVRALRVARTVGSARGVAMALEGLASCVGSLGDHGRAARLLGAGDAARRAARAPASPSEDAELVRITAVSRSALGEAAFNAAYQDGATQDIDTVA